MNTTTLQHYPSLDSFCHQHSLHIQMLPKPRDGWRLIQQPVLGGINGLTHKYRGLAVATNGIIVAILTSANAICFGHLEWFIKDEPDEETDLDSAMAEVVAARKRMQTVKTFDNLFEDECV